MNLQRLYCLADRFYLLRYVLSCGKWKMPDGGFLFDHPWLFARCREVQANSDGILDVWARGHVKTTIKTFAGVIQALLRDPNVTICLLSIDRPMAKSFQAQVKRELESNELLHELFPDILYPRPDRDSPLWNDDRGLIVNRTENPREATIEAWGLIDSQPIGKHFKLLVHDDTVTKESVTSGEMIKKTTDSWQLSANLGMEGTETWYTGTFYSDADTYRQMLEQGAVVLRKYPCYSREDIETHTLQELLQTCVPVLYSPEYVRKIWQDQQDRNFTIQMLCDPSGANLTFFKPEWMRYYSGTCWQERAGKNVYIFVDPASRKPSADNPDPDYTVMWTVGLGADHNFYVLDCVRDRLNLEQRTNRLFEMHQKWKPIAVRYEEYGLQTDREHILYVQEVRGYRFNINPVGVQGRGTPSKERRIERLQPLFSTGRIFFPHEIIYVTVDGERVDLVETFLKEEYLKFAGKLSTKHDDMLDALARIADPEYSLMWPMAKSFWEEAQADAYLSQDMKRGAQRYSWMGV